LAKFVWSRLRIRPLGRIRSPLWRVWGISVQCTHEKRILPGKENFL